VVFFGSRFEYALDQDVGFGVWDFGFGVLGFGVLGLEFRVSGLGFGVRASGISIHGLIWGLLGNGSNSLFSVSNRDGLGGIVGVRVKLVSSWEHAAALCSLHLAHLIQDLGS